MRNTLKGIILSKIMAMVLVLAIALTMTVGTAASANDRDTAEDIEKVYSENSINEEADADSKTAKNIETVPDDVQTEEIEVILDNELITADEKEDEASVVGKAEDEDKAENSQFAAVMVILEKYFPQLASLTDEQVDEIEMIWSDSNHMFKPTGGVIEDYVEIKVETETAFIISVANASACINYVDQNVENEYASKLVAAFSRFCEQLESVLSEVETDSRYDNMITLADGTFAELGDIAYQEYVECGESSIVEAISEYADLYGVEDCQTLFESVVDLKG